MPHSDYGLRAGTSFFTTITYDSWVSKHKRCMNLAYLFEVSIARIDVVLTLPFFFQGQFLTHFGLCDFLWPPCHHCSVQGIHRHGSCTKATNSSKSVACRHFVYCCHRENESFASCLTTNTTSLNKKY